MPPHEKVRQCMLGSPRNNVPDVESLQNDIKKLSEKLEVVAEYAQKLEKSSAGNAAVLLKKTQEIEATQILQRQRVSDLEAASAETLKQLPLFATSAQLAELTPVQMRSITSIDDSTYNAAVLQEDVKLVEQEDKIDLRLSELEQRFSKFEHRLSNVEEVTAQRPQLTEYWTQTDDLTTTMKSQESARHEFTDEAVSYSESSLKVQLTELSEKVHQLEQSVNESQVWEKDLDKQESSEKMEQKLDRNRVSEIIVKDMKYHWHHSIWDMSVFIFSEQMNVGESLVVVACLVFTMCLLMAFAREVDGLISEKWARFDATSQQDYHLWRTTVAHDVTFRNKFTDVSLASIVCNSKLYAPVSSLQLQTVMDLESYLNTETGIFFSLAAGQWMAALSVCVWYLVLVEEFRSVMDLMGASLSLKIGPETIYEQHADAETVCIVQASYCRKFFLCIILILRLMAVCTLGYIGTLFLFSEVDLENMILNSVALQMMLTFDDLLYHMVPTIPQQVVSRMQPLKIPSTTLPKWWHEWGLSIFLFVCAATIFICAETFYNIPFLEEVNRSYDALCGGVEGSYDFVVAVDSIGIPWAAATAPISGHVEEAYAHRAISSARDSGFQSTLLHSSQRFNLGMFMQVASSQELEFAVSNLPEFKHATEWSMIGEESSDVVGWRNEMQVVLGQQDFADEPNTVYNHYLQYLLQQTGAVSCAHAPVSSCFKYGFEAEDLVMRKLCPTYCGCGSPTEGTVASIKGGKSRSPFTGCAVWNTRKKSFADKLQDLPCADTQSRDDFVSWSKGVGDAVHKSGGMLIDHLLSAFDSGKCPLVAKTRINGPSICRETSLPSICPESCGCNTSQEWSTAHVIAYDFCPYSCGSAQPPCITLALNHTQDSGPRGPQAGVACIFPFKHQGVTYHSCTSKGWSNPWCAVSLKNGFSHFWGDCPNTSACVNRSA